MMDELELVAEINHLKQLVVKKGIDRDLINTQIDMAFHFLGIIYYQRINHN